METSKDVINIKCLEYKSAQDMLKHYDSLNWQIGSILIAAAVVMTGLVLSKDTIEYINTNNTVVSWVIVFGIPGMSGIILGSWFYWFKRHRELYNFRNEVLHRLEVELGMYHYLRVLESEIAIKGEPRGDKYTISKSRLLEAKTRAYVDIGSNSPFYECTISKPSGYSIAKFICRAIPALQLIILFVIRCA